MKIPKIEELDSPKKMGSLYLKKHYPEFYQYLCNKYKGYPIKKTTELIYLYYNGLNGPHRCPVCGKYTTFLDYKRGYQKYCGLKCSNSDPEVKAKKDATSIKKFGVAHAAQNASIKEKLVKTYTERHGGMGNASASVQKKQQATMEETYGHKHAMQNPEILKKSQDTLESHYGVRNTFKSDQIREKIKQTNLERYGVEYGLMAEEIREKIKQTNLERYGVECNLCLPAIREKIRRTNMEKYGSSEPFKAKDIKEKIKQTNLERYGDVIPMRTDNIKKKVQQTNLERYGVGNPSKSQDVVNKIIEIKRAAAIDKIEDLLGYTEEGNWIRKCPHPECNKCNEKTYIISPEHYRTRKASNTEPCTNILPIQQGRLSGTSIELFVRDVLDKNHIEYITNDRTVLEGKELDIYIPKYHLAIECNGVYWHSSAWKDVKYHFDKYIKCAQAGIQLLTIWEDQIVNKPDIVKSIICSKLGIYDVHIGARLCSVCEISQSTAKQFLNKYHLQGSIVSKYNMGLFYKDELVSVMTFGGKRKALGNKSTRPTEFELYRYCTKAGVQIVGGASKLLKYFIDHHKPTIIESFSSNDISNGSLYESLGFSRISETYGSYWYIDENLRRYHRFNFTKGKLVKEGADPNLSESEIMMNLGYTRIYDSGQTKWSLKTS